MECDILLVMKVPASYSRHVSLGQLLVGEISAFVFVAWILEARDFWMYALIAAVHVPWAIFTRACYWWNVDEAPLPKWTGNVAVLVAACCWVIGGRYVSK